MQALFQSTPPVWGATLYLSYVTVGYHLFQSTPPVWGATGHGLDPADVVAISIHAPRVGGDGRAGVALAAGAISIHAPRVGGDVYVLYFFGQ